MELKNYIRIVRKKLWLIIAITSFFIAVSAVLSIFIMDPVYEAKVTLIIGHTSQVKDDKVGYDDILMYQKLVKTYSQLAKSRLVGKEALDTSGYNMSYGTFQDKLKVTPMSDTQILEISVSDNDPNKAADLANTVSWIFVEKAHEMMDVVDIKVMDEALPPKNPEKPKPFLYTVISGLIGLMFSIGIVLLTEYMNNTIKSEGDITNHLSIPILASMPLMPFRKNNSNHSKLVTIKDPCSPASELYRSLRTNIRFMSFQKEVKTIVLTSPGPGDGKSTVTANLGITMASAGKKTLIVECDLRNPSVHRYFALPNDLGLTTILADGIPYKDVLAKPHIENLDIIPSGPKPPNPSEMLGSDQMKEFLACIRDEYDCILLDTPPVVVVTDAALLASVCDGTILILSHGHTAMEGAVKAKELLNNVNARILGTVLNKIKVDKSGWYYGYYQHYYGEKKRTCVFRKPTSMGGRGDHV